MYYTVRSRNLVVLKSLLSILFNIQQQINRNDDVKKLRVNFVQNLVVKKKIINSKP